MSEEVVLVAYSEIALKSWPVRKMLENQLTRHIKTVLKRAGITQANVGRMHGRLILKSSDSLKSAEAIAKIFGIALIMPGLKIKGSLESIVLESTKMAVQTINPQQTFAVDARRIGTQSFVSRDIEVKVGAEVLEQLSKNGVRVNLDNPDVTIHVEARGEDGYIYHQIIKGLGGLPFGSQGKLVSLFSGGIDSPVATWFMMKRGANVIPLFFDQRPFVGDDYYEKAKNVSLGLRQYVPLDHYQLNVAPMGEVMKEIVEKIPTRFICLACKRMMYRIACGLAERKRACGIVTGESLGQVASQTLMNLKVLDEVSTLPVYRPLIGFDKEECVELAKKIGTYKLSITRAHGCSVVPSKPATKARIDDVQRAEERLDVKGLKDETLDKIATISL
ncbi:MAG: putative tRNA sulfurtransferase [Thermoproteota archaeon]|nr:putative tRNA sulfurtransferase [Thermoproteota archaeon]